MTLSFFVSNEPPLTSYGWRSYNLSLMFDVETDIQTQWTNWMFALYISEDYRKVFAEFM